MNLEMLKFLIETEDKVSVSSPETIIKVPDKGISYAYKFRSDWQKPEWNFDDLAKAVNTESYMFRAIQKKVNRVLVAGYSFGGQDSEAVEYIENRFAEIAWATQKPISLLFATLFWEMFQQSNSIWVKVRDRNKSSGKVRRGLMGEEIEPVCGYFPLPLERLEFKVKKNGELKKVLLNMSESHVGMYGNEKGPNTVEFLPRDIVHFYANKRTGFIVGTPELYPALDDVALLRRIEENVEDLIETNLFPTFHYKVGTDAHPERVSPDGKKETQIVKQKIKYMPAGGIFVSDHRHEIVAIGSEGRALRIDFYLTYFKNRALAACGTSALDMGEGTSANRSTASTLSKSMLLDIEAMTILVAEFFNFYIINELLLEGGFNPLLKEESVKIKFGVIDKEEKRADENHHSQMFMQNAITMSELRQSIGREPWTEEHMNESYQKMFAEPLGLVNGMMPGSAAGQTLAANPGSNVTPESLKKEEAFVKQMEKQKVAGRATGRPPSRSNSGSRSASSRNRPSNQHGKRSTAKTTRDIVLDSDNVVNLTCDFEIDDDKLNQWIPYVLNRWKQVKEHGVSLDTVANSLAYRLRKDND